MTDRDNEFVYGFQHYGAGGPRRPGLKPWYGNTRFPSERPCEHSGWLENRFLETTDRAWEEVRRSKRHD